MQIHKIYNQYIFKIYFIFICVVYAHMLAPKCIWLPTTKDKGQYWLP